MSLGVEYIHAKWVTVGECEESCYPVYSIRSGTSLVQRDPFRVTHIKSVGHGVIC